MYSSLGFQSCCLYVLKLESFFSVDWIPYGIFSNVLKYLHTYNLRLNAVFLDSMDLSFCVFVSILYIVMYYLNTLVIKWDRDKLCRLPKRLPSGQIFLWTASLMISSSSPLSFKEHSGTRCYYSNMEILFKQKWKRDSTELSSSLH